jgi:uncharacterized DUF497 family protein
MKITWDEPKRLKNIEIHAGSCRQRARVLFGNARPCGTTAAIEGRWYFFDDVIAVIFVTLGVKGISLISLRPASRPKRNIYALHRPKTPYTH